MNGLLLLSVGLTAVVGSLCTLLYTRVVALSEQALQRREQLGRIEVKLHEIVDSQTNIQNRVDQLAMDVLQREIYQSADDRHHLAIQDAKEGLGLAELTQKHGLSSDEAALIIALHTAVPLDQTEESYVSSVSIERLELSGQG